MDLTIMLNQEEMLVLQYIHKLVFDLSYPFVLTHQNL